MLMKVNFDINELAKKYQDVMASDGQFMRSLNNKILKDMTPYVPFKSGELRDSATVSHEDSAKITWSAPHARSAWSGKTKTGMNIKAGRGLHPLAGPRWTERYKADHMEEIKSMIVRKVNSL